MCFSFQTQWERVRLNRKRLGIVGASTWLYILIFAPLTGFSILFVALEEEFHASSTATGEIGSVAWAVVFIATPLPTFLSENLGPRAVAALGVLMCGSGLLVSTFSSHIWMIYLFYGLVQGLGLCFIQLVTVELMANHFRGSSLVRALSFAAIGETVGMFVISPIFAIGFEAFGWRMVCQIFSIAIVVLCLPACCVLTDPTHTQLPIHDENSKGHQFRKDVAEDESKDGIHVTSFGDTILTPGVWFFSAATVLYVLGIAFTMISLVEILVVQGETMVNSAWFITIFAVSQTVGKVINVVIGNRLPVSNMKIMVMMCLIGGFMSLGMVFWGTVRGYIVTYSIVTGLVRANISSRNIAGAIEVFGTESSSVLINLVFLAIGAGFLSASFVGGLSYDLTGSYHSAHITISVIWILAAVLLLPLAFMRPLWAFKPLCRRAFDRDNISERSTSEISENGPSRREGQPCHREWANCGSPDSTNSDPAIPHKDQEMDISEPVFDSGMSQLQSLRSDGNRDVL